MHDKITLYSVEIYQFIAPTISIYYIFRIFRNIKTGKSFVFSSFLWLMFWLLITVLSIMPHELSTELASLFGFKDNVNTIVFIALAFLIVLSFYLSSRTEKLEKNLTELVRQLALKEQKLEELIEKENSSTDQIKV